MKHIPVKNSRNLVRDKSTGAIINIDKNGLELAKARKVARVKEQNELNELKSEVKELKELILQLSKSIDYK
jgi:flagellar motility protein MotE (MotC chaperone)